MMTPIAATSCPYSGFWVSFCDSGTAVGVFYSPVRSATVGSVGLGPGGGIDILLEYCHAVDLVDMLPDVVTINTDE